MAHLAEPEAACHAPPVTIRYGKISLEGHSDPVLTPHETSAIGTNGANILQHLSRWNLLTAAGFLVFAYGDSVLRRWQLCLFA